MSFLGGFFKSKAAKEAGIQTAAVERRSIETIASLKSGVTVSEVAAISTEKQTVLTVTRTLEPHFRCGYDHPPGEEFPVDDYKDDFRRFMKNVRGFAKQDHPTLVEEASILEIDEATYTSERGKVDVWLRLTCNDNGIKLHDAIEKFTKLMFHVQKMGKLHQPLARICSGSFFAFEPVEIAVRKAWYRNFILDISQDATGKLLDSSREILKGSTRTNWYTGIVIGLKLLYDVGMAGVKAHAEMEDLSNNEEINPLILTADIMFTFSDEVKGKLKTCSDFIEKEFTISEDISLDVLKSEQDEQLRKTSKACQAVQTAGKTFKDAVNRNDPFATIQELRSELLGALMELIESCGNLVNVSRRATEVHCTLEKKAEFGLAVHGTIAASSYSGLSGVSIAAAQHIIHLPHILHALSPVHHILAHSLCPIVGWILTGLTALCSAILYARKIYDLYQKKKLHGREGKKSMTDHKLADFAARKALGLQGHVIPEEHKEALQQITAMLYQPDVTEGQISTDPETGGIKEANAVLSMFVDQCVDACEKLFNNINVVKCGDKC